MPDFVSVYSTATGRKREIPADWLDNDRLMAGFAKTPLQRQADNATDLKGAALAQALEEADLHVAGTADEKRAALAAYLAEQAHLEVEQANDDLHDGDAPTDPLENTTDTPHGGDTEGA